MDLNAYIIPNTSINNPNVPMGTSNGFISKDGWRNPTVQISGYTLRERSEILLLKENKILLQRRDPWESNDYKIPGGGTDSFLSVIETAIKECQEEALVTPTNVKYYGAYTRLFKDGTPVPKWLKNRNGGKFPIDLDGYYTHVCVGVYKEDYKEKIAEHDKDDFYKKAKWVPIEEARKFLIDHHRKALDQYLSQSSKF